MCDRGLSSSTFVHAYNLKTQAFFADIDSAIGFSQHKSWTAYVILLQTATSHGHMRQAIANALDCSQLYIYPVYFCKLAQI